MGIVAKQYFYQPLQFISEDDDSHELCELTKGLGEQVMSSLMHLSMHFLGEVQVRMLSSGV